jgi:phosphoenolpyruvate---glycerone phosphotransferase subunit DhaL
VTPVAGGLDGVAMRGWIERFAEVFGRHRELLDDLDRQSGDGDFGSNLEAAMERIQAGLAEDAPSTPGAALGIVAGAFMHTGGTSGPLFGMWFAQLARAAGADPELGLEALADGVAAGLAGIQRLGGAQPGDKTMVDALAPAAEALAAAQRDGATLAAGLAAAAASARSGADATAPLLARRGRASYVGEAARGVADPGALTVALFFESAPASE